MGCLYSLWTVGGGTTGIVVVNWSSYTGGPFTKYFGDQSGSCSTYLTVFECAMIFIIQYTTYIY